MLPAALLLLLLFAPQAAPPPPVAEDEIVVVGRRMRAMRFRVVPDRRHGGHRCIVKRSSGDPSLDAAVCDIGLDCVRDATAAAQIERCAKPRLDALPMRYAAAGKLVSGDPNAR